MDQEPAASKDQVSSSASPPCSYQNTFMSPVQETGTSKPEDAATAPVLPLINVPPEANHSSIYTGDSLNINSDFMLLRRFILEAQDVKEGMELFDDSKLMM